MKYTLLLASFFVFACNTEEDKLKTQLSALENQLPQAEKEYNQAKRLKDSLMEPNGVYTGKAYGAYLDSLYTTDTYKNLRVGTKEERVDSLKKAIADTKEKILLNK